MGHSADSALFVVNLRHPHRTLVIDPCPDIVSLMKIFHNGNQ